MRHGNGELKKIKFYKRQAKKTILNSKRLSRNEKFYLIEDLKSCFRFLDEEDQIGGYCNNNSEKRRLEL
jgi:hypothetical protein